jgi:hypothetical protein
MFREEVFKKFYISEFLCFILYLIKIILILSDVTIFIFKVEWEIRGNIRNFLNICFFWHAWLHIILISHLNFIEEKWIETLTLQTSLWLKPIGSFMIDWVPDFLKNMKTQSISNKLKKEPWEKTGPSGNH